MPNLIPQDIREWMRRVESKLNEFNRRASSMVPGDIADGVNLDGYMSSGRWRRRTAAGTTTALNYPINTIAGTLEVYWDPEFTQVQQVFYNREGPFWTRWSNGVTWSTWVSSAANVWQAYTPTFGGTLGNGTVSGRWARDGGTVHANLFFQFGSTTSIGTELLLGLPVTASLLPGGGTWVAVRGGAYGFVTIPPGPRFQGSAMLASSTTVGVAQNGASNGAARWGATVPATWGAGNSVNISLTYEAA